jgi:hypothetical protein
VCVWKHINIEIVCEEVVTISDIAVTVQQMALGADQMRANEGQCRSVDKQNFEELVVILVTENNVCSFHCRKIPDTECFGISVATFRR